MFASRYFNPRYFSSRYWPKIGGVPIDTADLFFTVFGSIDDSLTVKVQNISDGINVKTQDISDGITVKSTL